MMTIEEGNKTIARFMGYEYYPHPAKDPGWRKEKGHMKFSTYHLCRNHKYLPYFNDWNQLIKVVEKIEAIYDDFHGYFGVSIYSNSCTIQGTKLDLKNKHHAYFNQSVGNKKIEAVWEQCVFFILWYNENLKK